MSIPSIEFLKSVLGEDGQKAFERANKRSGGIGTVLAPRAIVGWLSAAIKANYEGEIPGLSNSYITLQKSEDNFSGALTIGEEVYSFNEADILHVAASIAVALGINDVEVPAHLKKSDISKLGKSIDMLVKARVIAKAMSQDIQKRILDPNSGYTFSHEHIPSPIAGNAPMTHVKAHLPNGSVIGGAMFSHKPTGIESSNTWVHEDHQRRGLASAMYSHAQKITGKPIVPSKLQTDEGEALWAGNAKTPQFGKGAAEEAGPAAKPIPPTGFDLPQPPKAIADSTNAHTKPPMSKTELIVKKSNSERACQECGNKLFKNDSFCGCSCFKSMASGVKTKVTEDGYALKFSKSMWDADSIRALIDILMR